MTAPDHGDARRDRRIVMATLIKRYDVQVRGNCNARGCNPFPDPFESETGIWVDFNDYARITRGLLDEITRLEQQMEVLTLNRESVVNFLHTRAEAAEAALHAAQQERDKLQEEASTQAEVVRYLEGERAGWENSWREADAARLRLVEQWREEVKLMESVPMLGATSPDVYQRQMARNGMLKQHIAEVAVLRRSPREDPT